MIDNTLLAVLIQRAGGTVTQEQVQAAVDAYLEQNPVGQLALSGNTITITGGGN